MKYILVNILLLVGYIQPMHAQDSVKQRVILIGDAGEANEYQKALLMDAAKRVVPGKTTALFLGDNIYSSGIGLDASDKTTETENILRSQYEPLRQAGIAVYFIPGNHDWDHSGARGYEKIIRANEFINKQHDSLLQMIPKDACAGPYELVVTDDLVIIAVDSEWWLFPFSKHTESSDCEFKTKADILGRLDDIVQRNKNKTIILASHHPFKTYGSHGGYYNLREHIFPLTDLKKGLYIPLPVLGSLYPLLRTTFPPPEDVKNMLYQDMKNGMEEVLRKHPNVIHAAGHEHTLQLIQGALLEVVSGAGCKNTPVKKGDGSLFAESAVGYVVADLLLDNTLRISFFSYDKGAFRNSYNYDKIYTTPAAFAPGIDAAPQGDSITTPLPGNYNQVSKMHRKLFGENYRSVWATEVKLPVLRLSEKGLVPTERGGGMQTHSLRMEDAAKKEWVLRSVDKYPDALLPGALNKTFAADILKDNVTAAFPYAPMVVPLFADALKVPHSNPMIVYVAPDTNLGHYNKDFANTITLFEEREPMGKSISTLKMVEKLKEDNDNTIDQKSFIKARLLDIFLGDWDRHADQWRWIDAGKKKGKLYQPVPRDRDQVFYVNEGLFPNIISLPWLQPKFQGFGERISNINTFSFNARAIDGLFTNQLS
ncbi:MAG: metallophosphoesterase [Ferruginibacter sp.]